MENPIEFRDLGLADYKAVWDLQHDLFQQTIDLKIHNRRNNTQTKTTNHFLLVEHPPVITMGKSGKDEHLLLDKEHLKDKNIQYYKIDRGGDITFTGLDKLWAIRSSIWITFLQTFINTYGS
jgi:lipoyl(octanoyl) transferase